MREPGCRDAVIETISSANKQASSSTHGSQAGQGLSIGSVVAAGSAVSAAALSILAFAVPLATKR